MAIIELEYDSIQTIAYRHVVTLEYVLFKPEGLAGIWRSIDPEVSLFVGGIWLSN